MRLLLSILLALLLTVVQVYIGLETFFPSVFQEKARVVDELIKDKKPIINKLTPEEQAWITSHGTITVGVDPYFYPIETFDGRGQYSGLGGDYMKLLSHLTGIQFLPLRLNDWAATEHSAQAREVDMYMAAAQDGAPQRVYALYRALHQRTRRHQGAPYLRPARHHRGRSTRQKGGCGGRLLLA